MSLFKYINILFISTQICLALSVQEKNTLIQKYVPNVVMHSDDVQEPEPVDIMIDNGSYTVEFISKTNGDLMGRSIQQGQNKTFVKGCGQNSGYWSNTNNQFYCDSQLLNSSQVFRDNLDYCWTNGGCPQWAGLIRHNFDWPGSNPTQWKTEYLKHNGDYEPTVYATVFETDDFITVQYFYYFTYNDWVNNHESDWENINVLLNKDTKDLYGFEFFFHHKYFFIPVENTTDYDMIGNHLILYFGGYGSASAGSGMASHGIYPFPAVFTDVGADEISVWPSPMLISLPSIEEEVDGKGTIIPHAKFEVKTLLVNESSLSQLPNSNVFKHEIVYGSYNGTWLEAFEHGFPTINPIYGTRFWGNGIDQETEATEKGLYSHGRTSTSARDKFIAMQVIIPSIITPLLM